MNYKKKYLKYKIKYLTTKKIYHGGMDFNHYDLDKSIIFKNKEAEDKNYDYSGNIIFRKKEAEEEAEEKARKEEKSDITFFYKIKKMKRKLKSKLE